MYCNSLLIVPMVYLIEAKVIKDDENWFGHINDELINRKIETATDELIPSNHRFLMTFSFVSP